MYQYLIFTNPNIEPVLGPFLNRFSRVNDTRIRLSRGQDIAKQNGPSRNRFDTDIGDWKMCGPTVGDRIQVTKQSHDTPFTIPIFGWQCHTSRLFRIVSQIVVDTKKLSGCVPDQLQGFNGSCTPTT